MKSCILTNGYTSRTFPVTRGIRQGDSLSALLYILQLEPLSAYLRKTNRIHGIDIQGFDSVYEVKNKHYVDDTIICLKDINMTDECLKIIEEFGKVSGSRLNREKTVGLVMNDRVIYDNDVLSEVKFSLEPVKVLGVPIGKKQDTQLWNDVINNIHKKLVLWQQRNLSLVGKVLIIKSLGMSKLLFLTNFIVMQEKIIKRIEKMFFDFIWEGKRNRVKKEICFLPRKMGGIRMVDIRTSLKTQKIMWVKRILEAEEGDQWSAIPLRNFKSLDKAYKTDFFLLRVSNAKHAMKLHKITGFYLHCIETFQELCNIDNTVTDNDIIWCNKHILFDGKPLDFCHWAKSGVLYIKDIVYDGRINEQQIFDSLLYKASFYFDLYKLKVSFPPASIKQVKHMINARNYDSYPDKKKYILEMIIKSSPKEVSFQKLVSKDVYSILLGDKISNLEIKSKKYWQDKLQNQHIDFNLWYKCNFLNVLIPRKCADFNWKFFYGKVNVGTRLARMNISNGVCSLCKSSQENLDHLLFECKAVQGIWENIFAVLMGGFNLKIDKSVVVAGCLEDSSESLVKNMILSISRWIVWKRRNIWIFENKYINNDETLKWLHKEIHMHCNVLFKCKKLKNDKKILDALGKILRK